MECMHLVPLGINSPREGVHGIPAPYATGQPSLGELMPSGIRCMPSMDLTHLGKVSMEGMHLVPLGINSHREGVHGMHAPCATRH